MDEPQTLEYVAGRLGLRPNQAGTWLRRLMADGVVVLDKRAKPPRYRAAGAPRSSPLLPIGGGRLNLAEAVLASAKELLLPYLDEPGTADDVAGVLDVQKNQASSWLKRLVADGAVEKLEGARYRTARAAHSTRLFSPSGSEEPAHRSRS